jgi:hypothetical protein
MISVRLVRKLLFLFEHGHLAIDYDAAERARGGAICCSWDASAEAVVAAYFTLIASIVRNNFERSWHLRDLLALAGSVPEHVATSFALCLPTAGSRLGKAAPPADEGHPAGCT